LAACLPLLIFAAELCVVTISTVRIIAVARGMKVLAPVLGFFEISIWLFAIGKVMSNLSDPLCYLAFAGGFTVGNYLGVLIDEKLALGTVLVRFITPRDPTALVAALKAADFGVTTLDAHGGSGPVSVVLTAVQRKELPCVAALIRRFDPNGFYSVDDLQAATRGVFPLGRRRLWPAFLRPRRRQAALAE
jgi:uncharacterized protein YebE (UPF0316 family)